MNDIKIAQIFKRISHFMVHYYLKNKPLFSALRIALIYCILGSLWITYSSKFVYVLTDDIDKIHTIELYKGWFFVAFSSIIFWLLSYRSLNKYDKAEKELKINFKELNSAHKELLQLKEELSKLAYKDALTGMPNKIAFENNINHLTNIDKEHRQKFAVIYLDIDNFKNINDTMGHEAGDYLLKEFGDVLTENIKVPDLAARIGGDEFAIILLHLENNKVDDVIKTLIRKLRKPWFIKEHEFFITFSIGITLFPDDGDTMSKLMRNADTAMYSVKKTTKDNFSYHSHEVMAANLKKINMINSLRKAVINREFILLYQPIQSLSNDTLIGVEALIRWLHPQKGFISPIEFIPLAEESGLINDIDKWVLETAILQKKEWSDKGYPPIRMSINVSGNSLKKEGLVKEIESLLLRTEVDPSDILLEVTETTLIENIDFSVEILKKIKNMGVKIALDDFGTGYSSLTYLERLPIDIVKLDRSFIKDIIVQDHVNIIVETIIRLTHELLLEITAEGIETRNQDIFLKSKLCDYGQGYLYSKPVTKEEIEDYWK